MSQLVESLNKFSLEEFQILIRNNPEANIVFSSYSAFACVSMSASLFRDKTRSQILRALQVPNSEEQIDTFLSQLRELISNENTKTVFTSNRIWANKNIDFEPQTFLPNETKLGILILKIDFPQPGSDEINNEISRSTNGMIKDVVNPDDLSSELTFVLVNAIYFKSKWQCEFDYDDMKPSVKNFTLSNGEKIHVDMIYAFDEFEYAEYKYIRSVSIPYYLNEYDFVIVFSKNIEDYKMMESLTFHQLNENFLSKMRKADLFLRMPEFTIESTFRLDETFKQLGLLDAFEDTAKCTDKKVSYKIEKIIQKAKIIVNKEGTEAAAATVECSLTKGCPKHFFVDHPFIYFIRNKITNSILFEGFVNDPTA